MAAMTKHRAREGSSAAVRALIRAIDKKRRRQMGIFELNSEKGCIFRACIRPVAEMPFIPKEIGPTGSKVLDLHLWNEQVPPMPLGGPDLVYAKKLIHLAADSFHMLAQFVAQDNRAAEVAAISGLTSMLFSGNIQTGKKIFLRLGLQLAEHRSSAVPVRRFLDDLYAWMLMWTYNPLILRARKPLKIDWYAFWISRDALVEQFAIPHENRYRTYHHVD